jgi:hypothetical protein
MTNKAQGWSVVLSAAVLLHLIGPSAAQERKGETQRGAELYQSLRETINVGANLYNRFGDHTGCFRVYQGALISVKPFLTPELQKKVDAVLEKAEQLPTFSDRAFELRTVIDEIREKNRPASKNEEVEKTPEKKEATETLPAKDGTRAHLSGHASYDSKPLAAGYFIALVSPDGRRYSAPVQQGGAFQFRTPLPAGSYRLQIETFLEKEAPATLPALPPRYRSVDTSGLAVELRPGVQQLDVNLVK